MNNLIAESKLILRERIAYSELEKSGGDHPLTASCWQRLTDLMSVSLDACMAVIDAANDDELGYITEVLDDLANKLVSVRFVQELEKRKSRFDAINCSISADIEYAKKVLSAST